ALFYVPFALLYVALRSWLGRHDVRVLPAAIALVAVMGAAVLIGIWQEATRTTWQNPKVIVANAFAADFRTNSIFWDPDICRAHPIVGVGIGSFEHEYTNRERRKLAVIPKLRASHTTPVTILAELGAIGLAIYLLLIGAALATAPAVARRIAACDHPRLPA